MSFDATAGTRGARLPAGRFYRWVNRMATRRIRRKGGSFGDFDVLILTTAGAKSGLTRTNPVGWFPGDDGSWLIVASASGAARNPGWYHNIAAHPGQVQIEIDGAAIPVTAEQLHGEERAAAWEKIVAAAPRYAKLQDKTDRQLPVIRLTRVAGVPRDS